MPAARTPRRNGPYAPLSAFYADDDAVIALEDAGDDLAELLFLRGLAYCAREPKLNGFISMVKVRTGRIIRRPAVKLMKAAGRLVEVGLWVVENNDGWRVTRWCKWNSSYDEIVERLAHDSRRKSVGTAADSARNPNGAVAESERNGGGSGADSAPYVRALQGRALHVTSEHGSGTSTDGGIPPEPPPPHGVAELQTALSRAGIAVAWDLDPGGMVTIAAAVARCGVQALVKQARSRYQPNSPAFSVRAFVNGWDTLPAKPVPVEPVSDPCEHGFDYRGACALCRIPVSA